MRAAWLTVLAACSGEKAAPPPAIEVPPVRDELPSDAELGELAIMGAMADPDSWVPPTQFPFVLGQRTDTSWRAMDSHGTQVVVWPAETVSVPYGCDGHQLTVNKLVGAPKGPGRRCPEPGEAQLAPGAVWLRPMSSTWAAKPIEIANAGGDPARRDFAIGGFAVEVVRTDPTHGAVSVVRGQTLVHQMTFERAGSPVDDDPIDLLAGGYGVPVPEAAWSVDAEHVVMVFRVQDRDGVAFKTIVVGPERGRTVKSMGAYLERCGVNCS